MTQEKTTDRFWETKDLTEMSKTEWESLCDGCGRCCVLKLEDEETGDLAYTNIGCRLFDDETCSCSQYALRKQLVKGCVVLTPENIDRNAYWMPSTCAYRLLQEGASLPDWHPLLSGTRDSVHQAGISMRRKTIPEYEVDENDIEDFVIEGAQ